MAISIQILLTTKLGRTVIAAARTTFLLVGIASTAFLVASIAVPYSAGLLSSSLPRIKTLTFAYLSPSYLFITIHFIIIIIWKLNNHNNYPPPPQNEEPLDISDVTFPPAAVASMFNSPDSDSSPDQPDSGKDPPISGEANPDDESHDSMDATWKAILERDDFRRPRMSKSNTWERCGRDREGSLAATQERMFRKSKTFRRVSVGREELFGRAEAFIRTNYEQRRIQRQESEQRYMEMVNAAC